MNLFLDNFKEIISDDKDSQTISENNLLKTIETIDSSTNFTSILLIDNGFISSVEDQDELSISVLNKNYNILTKQILKISSFKTYNNIKLLGFRKIKTGTMIKTSSDDEEYKEEEKYDYNLSFTCNETIFSIQKDIYYGEIAMNDIIYNDNLPEISMGKDLLPLIFIRIPETKSFGNPFFNIHDNNILVAYHFPILTTYKLDIESSNLTEECPVGSENKSIENSLVNPILLEDNSFIGIISGDKNESFIKYLKKGRAESILFDFSKRYEGDLKLPKNITSIMYNHDNNLTITTSFKNKSSFHIIEKKYLVDLF